MTATAVRDKLADRAAREVESALKLIAPWMGGRRELKIKHIEPGGTPRADIEKGILYIPPMNGISDLMLARCFYYHESLHVLFSKNTARVKKAMKKPALFTILNSLEDWRIESKGAKALDGCRMVFNWARDFFNKDIAAKATAGETEQAPLWEAVCAMSMMTKGANLAWTPKGRAAEYIEAGYKVYQKVRFADTIDDCVDIAEELYEIFRDVKKGEPESKSEPKPESGEGEESEEGEESNEGENSKSKKSKENKKPEKNEESNESSESGDGDDSNEEETEGGEKASSAGGDMPDEDDEEEDGSSESGSGSEEGEGDNEENGEGSGSGDSNEESESGSEGSSKEGNGGDEIGNTEHKGTDGEEADDGSGITDKELEDALDEEATGKGLSDILRDKLMEQIGEIAPEEAEYTSVRDNDEYEVPTTLPKDVSRYNQERQRVSAPITGISRALDQALRTMTRSKTVKFMPRGKLDTRRLVHAAKNLDKKVFYRTEEGEELDTCVGIVIDESGSMGRHYREIRQLVIALSETLDKINVPFEVIGSTTKWYGSEIPHEMYVDGVDRTNPLRFKIYKTFSETWARVKTRVCHTNCHKHNADGEAVEMMGIRLAGRPEKRKIIFSLSDGLPDAGHNNERTMVKFLKRVCGKLRKAGTEVYGFGIGTTAPSQYYGSDNFIHLESATDMGHTFFKKLADIITKGRLKA